MHKHGLLVFIMGVSGAGKNTLLHLLTERNGMFTEIISYKSRPLRPGEIDGKDYHYLSEEKFLHAIDQDVFLEYAKVHDTYYYGTKRSDIVHGLAEGKTLLKEIDMQGIEHIAQTDRNLFNASLRIFLDLSQETMVQRITSRAPISNQELDKRLQSAMKEKVLAKQYASHIISAEGTVEQVYQSVLAVLMEYINGKA